MEIRDMDIYKLVEVKDTYEQGHNASQEIIIKECFALRISANNVIF